MKPGRPREFEEGVRVRLPADLHDAICHIALQRDEPVSAVIRESLYDFVVQNYPRPYNGPRIKRTQ